MLLSQKTGRNRDLLDTADIRSGILNLLQEKLRVLFLFGLQFKEPAVYLRPCRYLIRIQKNTYPLAAVFIVKGYGVTAQIDDLKPAIADGAGSEKLYGVWQAVAGFADGIEQPLFGKMLISQIYHEPADSHTRCDRAMKRFNHVQIFFKGMGTNIHKPPDFELTVRLT